MALRPIQNFPTNNFDTVFVLFCFVTLNASVFFISWKLNMSVHYWLWAPNTSIAYSYIWLKLNFMAYKIPKMSSWFQKVPKTLFSISFFALLPGKLPQLCPNQTSFHSKHIKSFVILGQTTTLWLFPHYVSTMFLLFHVLFSLSLFYPFLSSYD